MPLIGYARVATDDQTPLPQSEALQTAGCVEIHEELASGGNRARPALARVLERVKSGDTLVVVRIDRLARSLSHLLEVIEQLEAKGAFFRSLQDPIDTASPQGKFTLQVLGAAPEFERALIRERTKAGLASARTRGRTGTRAYATAIQRRYARCDSCGKTAKPPTSRCESLCVRRVLPSEVLGRAGRRESDGRLPAIVAALEGAHPNISWQAICDRLESMRERTPRGRASWQPSSVKVLFERAERLGLISSESTHSQQ